jgi:hypothetical protein
MKVVVLQSNYIPWKGYFDLINDADLFIFYDEVQYTKNDWRNRNQIYTKNGLQWLTIHINKDAVNSKISDVELPLEWQKIHFKSLYLGYKSAPQFNQLEELMNDYLVEKKWNYLKDLNHYLIKKISSEIGINTVFEDSTKYQLEGNKIERLINLLIQVGATEYISGPSGKNYLSEFEYLFEESNILISYKNYPKYKEYLQLNKPFVNNVSILDTIANVGYKNISEFINL